MTANQLDMFREGTTKVAATVEHPTPPAVTYVAKADVLAVAERLWLEGKTIQAETLSLRAGAVKDGGFVAMQPALAQRLGLEGQ